MIKFDDEQQMQALQRSADELRGMEQRNVNTAPPAAEHDEIFTIDGDSAPFSKVCETLQYVTNENLSPEDHLAISGWVHRLRSGVKAELVRVEAITNPIDTDKDAVRQRIAALKVLAGIMMLMDGHAIFCEPVSDEEEEAA
jgi:hypothetical protein